MTNPQQIVTAFDEILDYVYGRSRGRDYPHKDDLKTAQKWIDEGLTLPIACIVFYHRMSVMHEAWLRRPPNDREAVPHSLKFCQEHIATALSRVRAGGEPIAVWEQSESQWKARLKGFFLKGNWNFDLWGPSPFHPECRASPRLIAEAKKNAGVE